MPESKEPLLPFDVYYGPVDSPPVDWRKHPDDEPDDDADLEETPEHIKNVLGFDPKEWNEEGESGDTNKDVKKSAISIQRDFSHPQVDVAQKGMQNVLEKVFEKQKESVIKVVRKSAKN